METIYQLIEQYELQSGKQRWNEICLDIVYVYKELIVEDKLYTELELWSLLFEPGTLKTEKQKKLEESLKDTKHTLFFSKVLPYFLQDKFKEGLEQGKILLKNSEC